jgi:hypothetical protein
VHVELNGLGQPIVDNQDQRGTPVYPEGPDGQPNRSADPLGWSEDCQAEPTRGRILPRRCHRVRDRLRCPDSRQDCVRLRLAAICGHGTPGSSASLTQRGPVFTGLQRAGSPSGMAAK